MLAVARLPVLLSALHSRLPCTSLRNARRCLMAAAVAPQNDPASTAPSDPIVQHVIVRTDLTGPNWSAGSIITQCCHASVAAITLHMEDELVVAYLQDMARMHKVVVEVKSEAALAEIARKLREANIVFHEWIEQPENIPTCIATKPLRKSSLPKCLKRLPLLRVLTTGMPTPPQPTSSTPAVEASS
eukprot:m.54375 g.54375  ORF g.54375 m.54375 type:complete len:187 (-) comp13246_c0_seq1:432-992(-)